MRENADQPTTAGIDVPADSVRVLVQRRAGDVMLDEIGAFIPAVDPSSGDA